MAKTVALFLFPVESDSYFKSVRQLLDRTVFLKVSTFAFGLEQRKYQTRFLDFSKPVSLLPNETQHKISQSMFT